MESHTCGFLGGRSFSRLVQNEVVEEVGSLLPGGDADGVNLPVLLPKQRLNLTNRSHTTFIKSV